jgi:hypothetical protein
MRRPRVACSALPNAPSRPKDNEMATKWSAKWNQPKLWRLRGKAVDGMMVTLGRYETQEEAQTDCSKFAATGGYRELAI